MQLNCQIHHFPHICQQQPCLPQLGMAASRIHPALQDMNWPSEAGCLLQTSDGAKINTLNKVLISAVNLKYCSEETFLHIWRNILLTFYFSFISYVSNMFCILHYFKHSDRKIHVTQYWQFLHKGVCFQILTGQFVMNFQTMSFCIPCVCLSIIQYEENIFWVGFLWLIVVVQKLNHIQMQSQNLAVWSNIFSHSLFHSTAFAAHVLVLNPLPYPDSHEVQKQCTLQNSGNNKGRKWRETVFLCTSSLNLIVTHYIQECSIL